VEQTITKVGGKPSEVVRIASTGYSEKGRGMQEARGGLPHPKNGGREQRRGSATRMAQGDILGENS